MHSDAVPEKRSSSTALPAGIGDKLPLPFVKERGLSNWLTSLCPRCHHSDHDFNETGS